MKPLSITLRKHLRNSLIFFLVILLPLSVLAETEKEEEKEAVTKEITPAEIIVGGVMDLEGHSKGLGLGMKAGIEAALQSKPIEGLNIRFITLNDSYNPEKTIAATKQLIQQKALLFLGNVGTPTAKVALPLLAENRIPAIGFFTGAGLLRSSEGDIINYRASYVQETRKVIDQALQHGVKPNGICAYVQNDAYGMAGVTGIRKALENRSGAEHIIQLLDKILMVEGNNPQRNNMGPVGVYTRNTFTARKGYDSLKEWEKKQNTQCKLVVTVGSYESIARFIAYAYKKGEPWIFSAVSFTGADNFANTLDKFGVNDRVIMTQVVPLPNSDLNIVKEAKSALGNQYGYVSQEGFIVGRLLLYGLQQVIDSDQVINRANLLAAFNNKTFDLGGLNMDFTNDNQGSDLVVMTHLSNNEWREITDDTWNAWRL
ncbi:MAG TPA: branched-chain amino acid ABC transporter substrate-binding protein, partial [Thiothrix sp.]|nr:branched-chain amino acid ABC transporter substrate-binding protein [Thiothrix sp.]